MMDLIEQLAKSGNKLLEAAARDSEKWSKLKHNKQDLELFLQFNIAHLMFKPKGKTDMKEIMCTSNTCFIELFSKAKMSEKKKIIKAKKHNGIRTKDPKSVMTFNILENKYNTIYLDEWQLMNFINITPDNIEILDKMTNEILKRQVIDDLEKKK